MSATSRFLLTAFFLCKSVTAIAQHYYIVDEDGKKGISQWTGSKKGRVVKPRYEDVKLYENGIAALKLDGKWGFHLLETKGSEELTPHEYDSIELIRDYSSGKYKFMVLHKPDAKYVGKMSYGKVEIIDKPYKQVFVYGDQIVVGEPGNYALYSLTAPGKVYDLYPQDAGTLGVIRAFKKMGYFNYYMTSTGNYITGFRNGEQYTRVDSAWETESKDIYMAREGKRLRYHGKYNPPRWFDADIDVLEGWNNYFVTRRAGMYGLMRDNGTQVVAPAYDNWEFNSGGLKAPVTMFLLSSKNDVCIFRTKDEKIACLGRRYISREPSTEFLFLQGDDARWYLYDHYAGTFSNDAYKSIMLKYGSATCTTPEGAIFEYGRSLVKTVKEIPAEDTMKFKDEIAGPRTSSGFYFFKTPTGTGVRDRFGLLFPPLFDRLEPVGLSDGNSSEQKVVAHFGGYEIEGYLTGRSISGDITCNNCMGEETFKKNYTIKGDVKTTVVENYVGNGVYKRTTYSVREPDKHFSTREACPRCLGRGTQRGAISYVAGEIKISYLRDGMEKNYNNR